MAFIITGAPKDAGFPKFLASIGAALSRAFVALAEAQSRNGQIARLEARSDAELARMGLTREGIVAHVFRDKRYYI